MTHGDSPSLVDCGDVMMQYRKMQNFTRSGDYRGVLDYLDRLPKGRDPFLAFYTAVFSGHAKIALAIDSDQLLAHVKHRELTPIWHTTDRLILRLQAAISAREPLSMIRLGDGEGRFLAHRTPWVRSLISEWEAECMLSFIWETWFGQPASAVAKNDLESLGFAFEAALASADILGVTSAVRYHREIYRRGYLGLLECKVSDVIAERRPQAILTSAFAHIEMQGLSPFLQALIAGRDFVGVISPHLGLAVRLARYHGIGRCEEYIVPGESRLPEASRGRAAAPHFPDHFHTILQTLRVPYQGAVFLVAGGLLGKIYCDRIRVLGGIAIDVGSLVDAWMGFDSRPLDRVRRAWMLPSDPRSGGADPWHETAQSRFWFGGRHVWLDAAKVAGGEPAGYLGPLTE